MLLLRAASGCGNGVRSNAGSGSFSAKLGTGGGELGCSLASALTAGSAMVGVSRWGVSRRDVSR